jgi:tetratricopeptide (TPR) repeat protein
MPFGRKPDPAGGPPIDFDRIYEAGIRPAIEDAGLAPIRADAEIHGGIIHKAMYERLLLCEFAIADLTTANANVFYELGVRHASRPSTTVTIVASNQPIPFDLNHLRTTTYELGPHNQVDDDRAAALRSTLAERLGQLREQHKRQELCDSPLFRLLDDYGPPDIARLKTDVFHERVAYSQEMKSKLAAARRTGSPEAVAAVREELSDIADTEAGVLVDLYLSYRAVSDWQAMIELHAELPAPLARSVLVREQLGFALNRAGERDRALEVLEQIVAERGPSSETCGLIGRIHKDRWKQAHEHSGKLAARGHLKKAIAAYLSGFESDWRDAYPGINAVTLLELQGTDEALARQSELLPVVRYSVRRRLAGAAPDYWDHATLLELAVLAGAEDEALDHVGDALAAAREAWEIESTANNLRMIHAARESRGTAQPWVAEIIAEQDRAVAGWGA